MERRLAAILAADVVGYSRLMGEDEEGTLSALSRIRKDFIEPLVAEHRGRVVKLMGDGILAEFASVVDAVNCAVAWQNGIEEQDLQFRIDDAGEFGQGSLQPTFQIFGPAVRLGLARTKPGRGCKDRPWPQGDIRRARNTHRFFPVHSLISGLREGRQWSAVSLPS